MNKYPFIKCLHPLRVHNFYTHKDIIVPCGQCVACINRKNQLLVTKCQLESITNKYTYFITLTYDNKSIPRAMIYKNTEDGSKILVDVTERYRENGNIETLQSGVVLNEVNYTDKEVESLQRKAELNGYIPYLYKRDIQLFIKRLRKLISNETGEKIRYFACGEYGPRHFRPHYHILLYFNDEQTSQNLRKNLYKAWRFGRIDYSLSRGKCASYTAGYVNSTMYLPEVLRKKSTAPFSVHSTHLGEEFLTRSKEEIYKSSASDFNRRSYDSDSGIKAFNVWRSFAHTYFPKCRCYDILTSSQRLQVYGIYAKIRDYSKIFRITLQCKDIMEYLTNVGNLGINYNHPYYFIYEQCKLNEYFIPFPKITYEQAITRIYTFLRLSYHFLKFVCDGNESIQNQRTMLNVIENYYKDCEYNSLVDSLESQQVYGIENNCTSEEDYFFFYTDTFDNHNLRKLDCYKAMSTNAYELSEQRIKHKKLNDNNKIFN